MTQTDEKKNWFTKPRVETFSDSEFAIVVTLLVLDIKVPEIHDYTSVKELYTALISITPKLLSGMISFLMVCVIWVNLHWLFVSINFIDHGVFWLNTIILLFCSFLPYPTALVGSYIHNPVSLCFFGLVMGFLSVTIIALRMYLLRTPGLLKTKIDKVAFNKATRTSIIFRPGFYFAGAGMALISTELSLLVFLLLPLYFIFFNLKS